MRRPVIVLFLALLLIAARRRAVAPHPSLSLDPRRSFAVTDQAILDGFSFQRVMNAIVERSGTHTTAVRLYQQMFDTQNPKPGLAVADAPHCDDFLVDDKPGFNGLPRRCPTPEGILATTNPFAGTVYMPLALINRFDLAAADGSNCGQYRMIFAKKTATPSERLHFIFEAVLPNPSPASGIEGCRAVAQFWADLSKIDSISARRARLEQFFFTGIAGFEPVIDPDHYSLASGGGIRSLHGTRAGLGGNRFYQFRLAKHAEGLIAEPDVLENMPFGRFFDATYDSPAARGFRDAFIQNVRNLAIRDVNLYFMNIPPEFLMVESDPVDGEFEFIYGTPFIHSQVTPEGREFAGRITEELKKIGSKLSTTEVITRAETLNCVGCHFIAGNVGEGVVFPQSIDQFQHVSEQHVESGEVGLRFAISPAMRDVFIPHRMEILRRFLTSGTPPVHSDGGGRRTE